MSRFRKPPGLQLECSRLDLSFYKVRKSFSLNALDYIYRVGGSGKLINLDALERMNLFESSCSHTASTRMLSTRCIVLEGPQGFSSDVLDFINCFRGSGKRINSVPSRSTWTQVLQNLAPESCNVNPNSYYYFYWGTLYLAVCSGF